MRRTALLLTIVAALAPSTALAQTYGPYTFSGPSSWVTSATFTDGCAGGSGYPSGDCPTNVTGHSPRVCAANLNLSTGSAAVGGVCSTTSYAELFFGGVPITNVVGPDVIVFDSRFSIDGLAISIETSPGVYTPFLVWAAEEQILMAPGSGCDGATLAAAPVDLARFGLAPGFVTRRIRVASANAGSGCQADLTMAGVPDGGVVCSTNTDCNDGNPCTADECRTGGVCRSTPIVGPGCGLPNGQPCTRDSDCVSGSCVDGVCCDSGCAGQCEACNLEGALGTCSPVTGAPRGERPACATDETVCGGSCDGTTRDACAYPDAATICREGSCADGVAVAQAGCNGAGACPPEMRMECAPYLCGATSCAGECTNDDQCALGTFCAGGLCLPELPNGEPCERARQCGSDQCVDGVCCESACEGQCEACDVAGSEGTCAPVMGAPHGARPTCASDGSECGGSCDGTDRDGCAYPSPATTCGEATCVAGVATTEGSCNGAGSCNDGDTTTCDPYVCGDRSCLETCDDGSDCVAGRVCIGGACVVPTPDAGVPDAGIIPGVAGGGCGCSAPGTSRGLPALALLGLLGLVWAVRRRR